MRVIKDDKSSRSLMPSKSVYAGSSISPIKPSTQSFTSTNILFFVVDRSIQSSPAMRVAWSYCQPAGLVLLINEWILKRRICQCTKKYK